MKYVGLYSLKFRSKLARGVGGTYGYVGKSKIKSLGGLLNIAAISFSCSFSFGVILLFFLGDGNSFTLILQFFMVYLLVPVLTGEGVRAAFAGVGCGGAGGVAAFPLRFLTPLSFL